MSRMKALFLTLLFLSPGHGATSLSPGETYNKEIAAKGKFTITAMRLAGSELHCAMMCHTDVACNAFRTNEDKSEPCMLGLHDGGGKTNSFY